MLNDLSKRRWRGNGRSPLLIFTIYSTLTILLTWPTAAQLGNAIPGQLGDSYVHLWVFEWLKSALLNGQNLFDTHLIFYPAGVSLLNHNIAWVNFAFWLPLQALFGGEIGYSLAFLLIFPLNGLALFLLVREIVEMETAAFLAGLIGAFWPYNLSHHDHPNLILIAWVPLAMLYLLRLARRRRWQDAMLASLFVALIGITRWQLLLMALPLLLIFGLRLLWQERKNNFKQFVQQLLLASGIALLLILPFFTPLLLYQINRDSPQDVLVDEVSYGADLAAYVTLGSYHPLWGERIQPLTRSFAGNPIYVRFVGFTVLLLAGVGLFNQWQKTRFWLGVTAVYLLLALGSTLYLGGTPITPLPFRLIEDSFVVQTLRFPDRFNVLLVIPVSVLAAWGVVIWQGQRPFRHFQVVLPLLLSGLILFEYANQFPMLSLTTPQWFEEIANAEVDFAILDIPAFSEENYNKRYMFYQLVHHKALVEGRVARPPETAIQFVKELPFLQNLLTSKLPPADLANQSEQIGQLASANVEYIVLHRQFLSAEELAAWEDWFIRPSIYQDEEIVVYQTEPLSLDTAVRFRHILLANDANSHLGLIDLAMSEQRQAGEWLTLSTVWGTTAALDQTLSVCLSLHNSNQQLWQKVCQPVAPEWPTDQWQANEIVRANYQIQIDPFTPEGTYSVSLHLEDLQQQPVGQSATVGQLTVTALPRLFTQTQPTQVQTAVWQDIIQLRGYDLNQTPEQLSLTLHWQALSRPDKSYKFFVHLIDVASGELVAQTDYVPHDWAYPTNWWEAGEVVLDTAVLPLENVGSGTYQLLVGIYDPDSGERLLATTSKSNNPVDILLLTEIHK